MAGSIEPYTLKGGETRWRARWRDPDTHKSRERRSFRTKRDARAFLDSLNADILKGEYVDPRAGRALIGALGPQWIAAHRNTWALSHWRAVESAWRLHVEPRWGGRRLNEIKPSGVQAWSDELAASYSHTTVGRCVGILSGICATAVGDGLMAHNPCERVRLPKKQPSDRHYLTPEQLLALAAASGTRAPIILVLGLCGLRYGELRALRVQDVDFDRNRITIARSATKAGTVTVEKSTKGNQVRTVAMPTLVCDALRRQTEGKHDDDLVFDDGHGGYIAYQCASGSGRGWFKRALQQAGLEPMSVHDLRHTAASIAIHSGAHVKAVQRMLGHKSAAMTLDTYADLFDNDLDEVALNIDATMREAQQD